MANIARMTVHLCWKCSAGLSHSHRQGLGPVCGFVHALRNALIPVVTMIGLQFGGLMAGAVIHHFRGRELAGWWWKPLTTKDFPVVRGPSPCHHVRFDKFNR